MRRSLFLLPAVALAACSSDPSGPPPVSAASLQSKATTVFKGAMQQDPKSVSCAGELGATVGATQKCTVVDPIGGTWALTAKVSALSGDMANYDMTFDEIYATPADVAHEVGDLVGMGGLQGTVQSSVCPGPLSGTVGAEVQCTVTFAGGQAVPVTAKTVGTDSHGVKYDVYGDGKHWSR